MGKDIKIITGGLLDIDIEKVLKEGKGSINKRDFDIVLSTPKCDLNLQLLKNIEWYRDYNKGLCEDVRVIFVIDGADYRNYLHHYKDQLEITIIKRASGVIEYSTRYKFLILKNDADTQSDKMNYYTDEQLRSHTPIEIEGQCVDLDLYALDDVTVEGIYKNATIKDVISSELMDNLNKVNYGEGKPNMSLSITEFDNTNKYGHINIPTGTRLLELPTFLQNSDSYGVYNAGMGTFIQRYKGKKYYWIYPLLDIKQYDITENKLMLLHSNNLRVGTGGNTFFQDDKIAKIIPKYNIEFLNDGDNSVLKAGNNIAYSDPDNIYKSYRGIKNGETLIGDSENNIKHIRTKDMPDGSQRVNYLGTINNAYKYRSEVIKSTLMFLKLDWFSSDIDAIYPGMPCVYLTEHKDHGILKLKGIVQSTLQMYNRDTKETQGVITLAVMSPDVYRGQEEYKDSNLKRDKS